MTLSYWFWCPLLRLAAPLLGQPATCAYTGKAWSATSSHNNAARCTGPHRQRGLGNTRLGKPQLLLDVIALVLVPLLHACRQGATARAHTRGACGAAAILAGLDLAAAILASAQATHRLASQSAPIAARSVRLGRRCQPWRRRWCQRAPQDSCATRWACAQPQELRLRTARTASFRPRPRLRRRLRRWLRPGSPRVFAGGAWAGGAAARAGGTGRRHGRAARAGGTGSRS